MPVMLQCGVTLQLELGSSVRSAHSRKKPLAMPDIRIGMDMRLSLSGPVE